MFTRQTPAPDCMIAGYRGKMAVMLGLPDETRACLFDMDGVLTDTAAVHAAAWKAMFDEYLRKRDGDSFRPFDPVREYDAYVDGKPREDGTRSFLESRGIELPEGDKDDKPGTATIHGLSNRKNDLVLKKIEDDGVKVFEGSVRYVRAAREAGLRIAVVSSSANTAQVLESAGIADLFEARVDGVVAEQRHLPGKPHPDMFLAGAQALNVAAGEAVVFEDALAGVQAGRAGNFALVVGVDRVGQADALHEHGADIVVKDLSELLEMP
jgi:beta-phosphoglucomutase family hydrolase